MGLLVVGGGLLGVRLDCVTAVSGAAHLTGGCGRGVRADQPAVRRGTRHRGTGRSHLAGLYDRAIAERFTAASRPASRIVVGCGTAVALIGTLTTGRKAMERRSKELGTELVDA
ncbi:hypothetical protein GCM10010170_113490 [Dactylosporangium salmoneum]|uniref:Uncharacterized protein n=1 Tax=Dactylosporangium salmoneum TaxID=53361 RepID=A0ABP5VBT6_9ACTN